MSPGLGLCIFPDPAQYQAYHKRQVRNYSDDPVDHLSVRGVEGLLHLEKLAPACVPVSVNTCTHEVTFRIPTHSVCSHGYACRQCTKKKKSPGFVYGSRDALDRERGGHLRLFPIGGKIRSIVSVSPD